MLSEPMALITLPIRGTTSKDCAKLIGDSIQKLPGVSQVMVDIENNSVLVVYNNHDVDLFDIQGAINDTGFDIAFSEITLNVHGMHCPLCITLIEGGLNELPGVIMSTVNLGSRTVKVRYLPELCSIKEMERSITKFGYQVSDSKESYKGFVN